MLKFLLRNRQLGEYVSEFDFVDVDMYPSTCELEKFTEKWLKEKD